MQEEEDERYYPTPPKFTPQPDETGAYVAHQRIGVHFMVKVPKGGITDELQTDLDLLTDRGVGYSLCDESGVPYMARILDDVMYRRSSSDERRIMLGMIDETKPVETLTEETAVEETTTK